LDLTRRRVTLLCVWTLALCVLEAARSVASRRHDSLDRAIMSSAGPEAKASPYASTIAFTKRNPIQALWN
jgi:hypothetical protein